MNRFLNSIIRSFFVFIFTIGVLRCSFAQIYNHFPIENYTPKQYGPTQSAQNWCVTQSKEGLMYFGNSNGIVEYDGRNWNFIQVLNGRYVFSLATDNTNILYAGTQGNFGYFAKSRTGKLKYISLSDSLLPPEKRLFTAVWRIFVKEDEIYFQTEEAIFIYNKKTISVIKPEKSFHLAMQVNGDIYARERGVGLIKIERNQKKIINASPIASSYGLFGLLNDNQDKERQILITQELGLFWLYKNGTIEEIPGQDKKILIDSKILGGVKLPGNRFALNTELNGTIIIDHHGKIIHFLNSEINIQNNTVIAQYLDKIGNLWLCLNKGITKVALHSPLQFFGPSDGLSGNIYGSTIYGNSIYVASSDGLFSKKNAKAKFSAVKEIPFSRRQVMNYENQLLIASEGGLFLLDGQKVKKIIDGSFNALRYSESDRKIIAATKHDIFILNQNTKEDYHLKVTSDEIFQIAEGKTKTDSKNYIWLTTLSGGVYVIDLNTIPVRLNDLSFSGGLPAEWLYPFSFNQTIFLGCNYGILSPKGKSFDSTLIFEDAGILNTEINESFSFYTQTINDKKYFIKENHIHYLPAITKANSIPVPFNPIELGKIHHLYSSSNQLLISGDDGLVAYNENDSFNYKAGFNLILRNISIKNDSTEYISDNSNELKINSPFKYSQNSIQVVFAADYYYKEDKLEFFARLAGPLTDSVNWNSIPEFEFNNLAEGTYTLTATAKNIFEKTCADCTGHGVPGGFMSMVCSDKLNEAVMHHQHPGEILKFTNRALKKSLRQEGSTDATKDGKEIALVKINTQTKKLYYSGANRFLWIIRKNTNEVTDIKPTKTGIGGTTEDSQEFFCHEFSMESGDWIFLSSDGFGDQFGGEKLKKLTTKRFKEILIKSWHLSIEEQRSFLKDFFEKWKGAQEQVDDILVIGTKF